MSPLQISRSPDLQRLRDEGFNIEVRANYLHVHDVPYVTSAGEVAYGTIVSELTTNGVSTVGPTDHTVCFVGGIPHDIHGEQLSKIINNPNPVALAEGVIADCQFSATSRPAAPTPTTTRNRLLHQHGVRGRPGHRRARDPQDLPRRGGQRRGIGVSVPRRGVEPRPDQRSDREVGHPQGRHRWARWTGAYILDQVAKTPVGEIHLHDPDRLHAHNAFRSPGAASIEQLTQSPLKVDYYKSIYDVIRYGIVAHAERIDENTIAQLQSMSFVFLAIDSGPCRKFIAERLLKYGVPLIDCGIGVYRTGESLAGIVRTTTCTPERHELHRLPVVDDDDDEYNNIQLADLNALNAIHAVIKWKKLFGFYTDLEREHHSAYTIDGNHLTNEDSPE